MFRPIHLTTMVVPGSPSQPGLDLPWELVERLRAAKVRVPPYPAVIGSLERAVRDPRSTVSTLSGIVGSDAALAAVVLRHAATAAMATGGAAGAATLEAAIRKLGIETLMRVVMTSSVGAAAMAPGPLAVLRRDQWRRSLLAALLCRELAPRRGLPAEQAFLAGLLHDFGAVVVIATLESLGNLPVLPEATWQAIVEHLHLEIGGLVAASWKLPEVITEVIAHHHAPHDSGRVHRPMVQLVAVTDEIVAILDREPVGGTAALADIPGLDHDERYKIGGLVPKVAEQMATFEAAATRAQPSPIEPAPSLIAGGWPIDLEVEGTQGARYKACALAPNAFAFRSQSELVPAWLTQLTLRCPPDAISMLANVKTCEREGREFVVTVQPFALDGEDKQAWLRLLQRTRPPRPPTRPPS